MRIHLGRRKPGLQIGPEGQLGSQQDGVVGYQIIGLGPGLAEQKACLAEGKLTPTMPP